MGIKAKSIKAKNVVGGFQVLGGEAEDLERILRLARNRLTRNQLNGGIEADSIEADNLVEGLQWVAPGAIRDLAGLRAKVEEMEQEVLRSPDAEVVQARKALTQAKQELDAPQPDKAKVEERLKKAATILAQVSKAAEAAGKLGKELVRWTVGAAGLWEIAGRVLGG